MKIKPLLLAGGRSTRMGSRKELLCLVNDIPIYEHQLLRLHLACPESDAVFLSLPDRASLEDISSNPRLESITDATLQLRTGGSSFRVHVLYDNPEQADLGPAGGLLAAHRHDPDTSWLVVACDYPFLPVSGLRQLREELTGAVTCFENEEGFCEPLLGIWNPAALKSLRQNVEKGFLGPKSVVMKNNGRMIRPHNPDWLFNMNTPADFESAFKMKGHITELENEIKS